MGEKINVKTLTIVVLAIVVLLVGIFIVVKIINGNNKNYELEKISEKDYKYFVVVTDEKYGVIDTKRKLNN